MLCGVDGRDGEPGAILFRRKAGSDGRGERGGDERDSHALRRTEARSTIAKDTRRSRPFSIPIAETDTGIVNIRVIQT